MNKYLCLLLLTSTGLMQAESGQCRDVACCEQLAVEGGSSVDFCNKCVSAQWATIKTAMTTFMEIPGLTKDQIIESRSGSSRGGFVGPRDSSRESIRINPYMQLKIGDGRAKAVECVVRDLNNKGSIARIPYKPN